jgi:hypothetical protein
MTSLCLAKHYHRRGMTSTRSEWRSVRDTLPGMTSQPLQPRSSHGIPRGMISLLLSDWRSERDPPVDMSSLMELHSGRDMRGDMTCLPLLEWYSERDKRGDMTALLLLDFLD